MALVTIPTVISFGCPRSGTTFLHYCLQALEEIAVVLKLAEGVGFHPAQSRIGLWELAKLYRVHQLILIRTIRHPVEIAESFLATRLPEVRPKTPGLAMNTDRDIVHWIREESTSMMMQRPILLEEGHVKLIEVRLESLADDRARVGLVRDIQSSPLEAHDALEGVLGRLRGFGLRPKRTGRLSTGLGRVSTDEELDYFQGRLRGIIRREGYQA